MKRPSAAKYGVNSDRPKAPFVKGDAKPCVKSGCEHPKRHGQLCREHAICEWEGCSNLKLAFTARARWCREHGEQAEQERRSRWNKKASSAYKSKPQTRLKEKMLPHAMSVALILGRDPFR